MNNKYLATPVYFHVMAELVRAAQYRGITTYQDVAVIMGLPVTGSHMGKETGQILGEISEEEASANRPMLSAIAVDVNGKVGPGFFKLAQDLGKLKAGEDKTRFWEKEREAVYKAWRRPLPRK